jgi:argininosuccinate lyase
VDVLPPDPTPSWKKSTPASISTRKLYAQDIAGSLAHAAMLAKTGIISNDDSEKITHGLNTILSEIKEGHVHFSRVSLKTFT